MTESNHSTAAAVPGTLSAPFPSSEATHAARCVRRTYASSLATLLLWLTYPIHLGTRPALDAILFVAIAVGVFALLANWVFALTALTERSRHPNATPRLIFTLLVTNLHVGALLWIQDAHAFSRVAPPLAPHVPAEWQLTSSTDAEQRYAHPAAAAFLHVVWLPSNPSGDSSGGNALARQCSLGIADMSTQARAERRLAMSSWESLDRDCGRAEAWRSSDGDLVRARLGVKACGPDYLMRYLVFQQAPPWLDLEAMASALACPTGP